MAQHGEVESLGSGLQRQMSNLQDIQSTIKATYKDISHLKTQCDALKSHRQHLEADCAKATADLTDLVNEIGRTRSERDTLRIEYTHASDVNHWWSQLDLANSAEFDGQGKLTRRLWLVEQKNTALEKQIGDMRHEHGEELSTEIAVAAGLRDRIGVLEEKVRKRQKAFTAEERAKTEAQNALRIVEEQHATSGNRQGSEWTDIRAALQNEKAEVGELRGEVNKLAEERRSLQEELRQRHQQQPAPGTPRKVLQARSPNILPRESISPTPRTPTKAILFSPINRTLLSPHQRSTQSGAVPGSPTIPLAKRHAHLEDRHKSLKAEYDSLRSRYLADLQHWKEWKTVYTAREEIRQQKKATRKAARATNSGSTPEPTSTHDASVRIPVPLVEASDESFPMEQKDGNRESGSTSVSIPIQDEEVSRHRKARLKPLPIVENDCTSAFTILPQEETLNTAFETARSLRTPAAASHMPIAIGSANAATPKMTDSSSKARLPSTARITPWLGGGEAPMSTSPTKSKGKSRLHEIDDFGDEEDLDRPLTRAGHVSSVKTPLIRDRLGETVSRSSLRRQALARHMHEKEDIRIGSPLPNASSATKKRKPDDTTTMSPSQKALELKKLSKLSAPHKREYYAQYKQEGRYLRPGEVRSAIFDEFEIDPEQNEGAGFQFHDVKRRKTERQKMHGGDCECCKGYYESVGPVPKYNPGPRWKDPSQTDPNEGEETEGHQNMVSRHRETWRKPPTPPGYWQIGFPTTQQVQEQNAQADAMTADREAQVRREAAHRDSKWRKKA